MPASPRYLQFLQTTFYGTPDALEKSKVKAHTRKMQSGAIVQVKEHHDKRTKKAKAVTIKNPHEPMVDAKKVERFVPVTRMAYIKERVEQLNRKAKKLGLPQMNLTQTGERKNITQLVVIGSGREQHEKKVSVLAEKIVLTGEVPRLNGWKVLAAIKHTGGANIVLNVSGDNLPAKWRTAASNCDHCKTDRDRNDTYIVAKGKEIKQVGKTCLKDFTGAHGSPEKLVGMAESIQSFFDEIEDPDLFNMGGGLYAHSVDDILELAVENVMKHGFVSKKMVQEGQAMVSTAEEVLSRIFDRDEDARIVSPEAKKETEKLKKWLASIAKKKNKTDFEHNLAVFYEAGSIEPKRVNLAAAFLAAAYPAYLKEKAKGKQTKKDAAKSSHVGKIGERYNFDLKIAKVGYTEGHYGTTWIYKYEDKDGNHYTYFSSKKIHGTPDIGSTVSMDATVKDHKEYQGVKETVITRAKLGGSGKTQKLQKAEFADAFSGMKAPRQLTREELIRAIRQMIASEYEAIQLYVQLAESTDDTLAAKVLREVADEEKVHAGEFLELLRRLDPQEEQHYQEGQKEVQALAGDIKKAIPHLYLIRRT